MKTLSYTLCILALLAPPALAGIGQGLHVVLETDLAEPVSIVVAPEGGEPLTEGLRFGAHPNDRTDATLVIRLLDDNMAPVAGYPAEDLWLQTIHQGYLVQCDAGAHPDAATDAEGRTIFSGPFAMGGHCDAGTALYLTVWAMDYLQTQPRIDLRLVSPDLNGDLAVDLTDVQLFATDYFASTAPDRSDFVWDGVINLSDLIVMLNHVNTVCEPFTP